MKNLIDLDWSKGSKSSNNCSCVHFRWASMCWMTRWTSTCWTTVTCQTYFKQIITTVTAPTAVSSWNMLCVQCPQWADEIWGDNWLRGKFLTGVYQMFHLFSACLLKPLSRSSKSVSNCFINFLLVYWNFCLDFGWMHQDFQCIRTFHSFSTCAP